MLLPLAAVKELAVVSCSWVANTVVVMWYCRILVSRVRFMKSCVGVRLRALRAAPKACGTWQGGGGVSSQPGRMRGAGVGQARVQACAVVAVQLSRAGQGRRCKGAGRGGEGGEGQEVLVSKAPAAPMWCLPACLRAALASAVQHASMHGATWHAWRHLACAAGRQSLSALRCRHQHSPCPSARRWCPCS
jgi:hypothetical protein